MRAEATRALARLDRRAFLRWSAGAAALLSPGCRPGSDAADGAAGPESLLGPRPAAVLRVAAERLAGGESGAAIRAGALDPLPAVERFLASAPALAAPLRQALWLLELGGPLLAGRLRPFTALDGATRDAVLARLMGSRFALARQVFAGVKSVALLGVYGSPAHQPVERRAGLAAAGIQDAMR